MSTPESAIEASTASRGGEAPYLSVIVPAYNEETRVPATIQRIEEYLNAFGRSWELIVVDDGSRDNTIEAAKKAMKSPNSRVAPNPRNMGKGASIRNGMTMARGQYRLFSDADLSTPIEELEKLLAAVEREGAEVAIGSRAMKESQLEVRQPLHREMMGRVFNIIVRTMALGGIKDTQCGFKLFTARAAEAIFPKQRYDGFSFDVEILVLARKQGFRIVEVPVRWIDSPASRVSPIKDSAKMFWDVIKIRFRRD